MEHAQHGRGWLSLVRLDKCLARYARRPKHFAHSALRLCAALDARGCDLEVCDPSTWRGTGQPAQVAVENQLSIEIKRMLTLSREEELRLAMRIEFARLRLERALAQHGLDIRTLAEGMPLAPAHERRRQEWHALRLEMVERNLYLVLMHVARYGRKHRDRPDLIQAAAAVFFRAVDGFDWRRGVLFRTYALHWLNQGFRGHLYEFGSTVRVPIYLRKALKHVNSALQELGDSRASVAEIARVTGLSLGTIVRAQSMSSAARSLDAPLDGKPGSRTMAGELTIEDERGAFALELEDGSIASGVEAALDRLTQRQRLVVKLRFGIGYDRSLVFSEIAEELGVSQERVRQILNRAIFKMRTPRLRKLIEPLID